MSSINYLISASLALQKLQKVAKHLEKTHILNQNAFGWFALRMCSNKQYQSHNVTQRATIVFIYLFI